ncbi:MAG: hypothetical protein OXU42_07345 [Deltaproteobacteria bacterium]|nr:hypothetical protein [Deltaproteobacteria bacterium]
MRIRADEHISVKIVRSIKDICGQGQFGDIELSSVYDEHHQGSSDEYWITEFANKDGNAILTADTDFFRKPNQIVAIHQTRLTVFHLPPRWANAQAHLQAAHLLIWWPRIVATLREDKRGEVWTVPWNIKDSGELKQRKIDYQEAYKKLGRSRRR